MIRDWMPFLLLGGAMILISIYGATRPESKWCSDFSLGVNYSDGKCHTFGSAK